MFRKMPDVFVIVFALIVVAAALTWILPGGAFERRKEIVDDHEREVVVEGSFRFEESKPQHFHVFTAPLKGFLKLADIIVFIFLVGGSFYILNETGAISAGTHKLVKVLRGREFLIIPIVMVFFSFFGAALECARRPCPLH